MAQTGPNLSSLDWGGPIQPEVRVAVVVEEDLQHIQHSSHLGEDKHSTIAYGGKDGSSGKNHEVHTCVCQRMRRGRTVVYARTIKHMCVYMQAHTCVHLL